MFNRKQNFNGFHIQQKWMEPVNMGGPYYPVSPHSNFSHQLPTPNLQHYPTNPAYYQSSNGGWNYQPAPYQTVNFAPYYGGKNSIQTIFQNPLEPKDSYEQKMNMGPYSMNLNPYPKTNMIPKSNGGIGSIMNSFKGQDGNVDLNKMVNTAGQMMNAVSQVSAMVKGLGGMFKV
jgi:hypothetical protein